MWLIKSAESITFFLQLVLQYMAIKDSLHIDDKPFMQFIVECIIESQKEIMRLLHMQIPKLDNSMGMQL